MRNLSSTALELEPPLAAQIDNAVRIKHLMMHDAKAGKFERCRGRPADEVFSKDSQAPVLDPTGHPAGGAFRCDLFQTAVERISTVSKLVPKGDPLAITHSFLSLNRADFA